MNGMDGMDAPGKTPESDLAHVINRLAGLIERIDFDISRVCEVANSIYGATPMVTGGKGSPEKPFGRMQDIGDHLSRLDDLECALREQIERLGRL